MKSLKAEKEILKNSKILQFLPIRDQQGLIRAQGRIGKSQLNFETKHPILLHWKHHVVDLFLRNEHKDWLGVARRQGMQCWAIDQSRKMFCQPRYVLLNRR